MPLVYLAGPIAGLTFANAKSWRWEAELRFMEISEGHDDCECIQVLSPLRGKNTLLDDDHRCGADMRKRTEPKLTERGVFGRDMNDVQRCDVVLANFLGAEMVSIGTVFELGVAYSLHKPIVCVVRDVPEGDSWTAEKASSHNHAFLRQAAVYTVHDLMEGVDLAASLVGFPT